MQGITLVTQLGLFDGGAGSLAVKIRYHDWLHVRAFLKPRFLAAGEDDPESKKVKLEKAKDLIPGPNEVC